MLLRSRPVFAPRLEQSDIRPCVGAGYCLDRIYVGLDALCLHNAATGREHIGMSHVIEPAPHAAELADVHAVRAHARSRAQQQQQQPLSGGPPPPPLPAARARRVLPQFAEPPAAAEAVPPRRKVVVVGGGPAGLEAARVCAERQHEVVLFEAGGQLGGQVRLAQRATWRRDLALVADWLAGQVHSLGVDVRFTLAEAADVLAEQPDVVVVATGGYPDMCGYDADPSVADRVWSVWDVLSGAPRLGLNLTIPGPFHAASAHHPWSPMMVW
jgi:NADPH-dependent 2,4-dienoyl-CoA reductase/sulfur reductase-like enzyme